MVIATERTKSPRRPRRLRIVLGLTVLSLAAVGSLVLLRATSLRGLPDIGDPFDVAAYAEPVIPDEENAYTYYRRAAEQLGTNEPKTMKGGYRSLSEATEADLRWLEQCRAAMLLWREGTTRTEAVELAAKSATINIRGPVSARGYTFCRLANLESIRLEHAGDMLGAWTWLRANLRASRHAAQHGGIGSRALATGVYDSTSQQAIRWSDDPRVDATLLRQALQDVLALDSITRPNSEFLRYDYITILNTLENPERLDLSMAQTFLLPEQITPNELWKLRVRSSLASLNHEPERSRRVIRLIFANWLTAIDLPAAERARRAEKFEDLALFQPAPGEPSPISLEEIARWYESTRYAKGLYNFMYHLNRGLAREEANRAALIVHLAEQLYQRERGKPPASAQELVGPYLKALPVGYIAPGDDSMPQGSPK